MPLDITLTNEQEVTVHAMPMTAAGHPATVDGPVTFSVTAGDCTIAPIDDLSATILSGAGPGDSSILVEANVNMDPAAPPINIMDTITVHVQHANAASLGLTADAPVLKP